MAYGLYYDANSPELQEIIDCKARECKFVRDINDSAVLTAAKNSPFFDMDVVRHFLKILSGTVTCDLEFKQRLLCNYLVRGFNNMIVIMHNKFIQFLSEAGLSKELLSYIM